MASKLTVQPLNQPKVSLGVTKAPTQPALAVKELPKQTLNPTIVNGNTERINRLGEIVKQMVANGEPDSNIQLVVNDFKQRYGLGAPAQPEGQQQEDSDKYLGMSRNQPLDPQMVFGPAIGGLKSFAKTGTTLLDQTGGRIANMILGKGNTPTTVNETLNPQNTQEQLGGVAGKLTQAYMLGNIINPAFGLVDKGIKGTSWLSSLGRAGTKGLIEGVSQGALSGLQENSKDAALVGGLTGGLLRSGTSLVGDAAKALKVPERLITPIFKNNAPSVEERFQSLAQQRAGKEVVIPKSLAEKALAAKLPSNIDDMGVELTNRLAKSEQTVINLAKKAPAVNLEPQYGKVLREIQKRYAQVGLGGISTKAKELADGISSGKTSAENALAIRRFLDGFRINSSFDTSRPVSLAQEGLKELTDGLRGRLSKLPGFKDAMSSYKDQIDLLEAVANEASRQGNNQVFGLIDSVLITGEPSTSLGAFATRRFLNSTTGKMQTAKTLNTLGSKPLKLGQLGITTASSLTGQSELNQ